MSSVDVKRVELDTNVNPDLNETTFRVCELTIRVRIDPTIIEPLGGEWREGIIWIVVNISVNCDVNRSCALFLTENGQRNARTT